MQLNQRRYRDARHAEQHPSAGGGIEYPRRRHNNHAGCCLEVNNRSGYAPLSTLTSNAIMDLDPLPDMGRMTGRLPLAARITSLPVPMPAAAAAIYSLIESAKLNGLNPQHYLADILARVADHPARRIAELPPWNWQPLDATRAGPPRRALTLYVESDRIQCVPETRPPGCISADAGERFQKGRRCGYRERVELFRRAVLERDAVQRADTRARSPFNALVGAPSDKAIVACDCYAERTPSALIMPPSQQIAGSRLA
jgi:hypothetical protein